jgi:uncharacterized membrane protein
MIESPLALAAAVTAVAALGFWLERRFPWAEKLGASLLVIALGALLSNLGLVPARSEIYDAVYGPVTSLAIVWLLLAVDLRDLRAAGLRMLGAFALAVAGTVAGAFGAVLLFGAVAGEETWKLAGTLVGTYTGGGLNFAAVGRALGLPESLFAAAAAADNAVTALWMVATLLLPRWLGRFYPRPPGDAKAADSGKGRPGNGGRSPESSGRSKETSQRMSPVLRERAEEPGADLLAPVPLHLLDLAVLLALGLGLQLAAEATARALPWPVPPIVWLTTFALAVAQVPAVRCLQGALHLGTLALNLFFVVIGIGSRVAEILAVGLEVFYFTAAVVLIHGLVTFVLARLARLDVETTAVASQAAVGGPSTAMALAIARRRPGLALPGLMAGLLGYAVGTYLGLAVAYAVRGL